MKVPGISYPYNTCITSILNSLLLLYLILNCSGTSFKITVCTVFLCTHLFWVISLIFRPRVFNKSSYGLYLMYTLCMWDALISLRWVHYRGLNVRRVFARTVCGISDLLGSDSPLLPLSCHLHLAFVLETSASGQVALWLYFIHGSETGRVGQPLTLPPLLMISE